MNLVDIYNNGYPPIGVIMQKLSGFTVNNSKTNMMQTGILMFTNLYPEELKLLRLYMDGTNELQVNMGDFHSRLIAVDFLSCRKSTNNGREITSITFIAKGVARESNESHNIIQSTHTMAQRNQSRN